MALRIPPVRRLYDELHRSWSQAELLTSENSRLKQQVLDLMESGARRSVDHALTLEEDGRVSDLETALIRVAELKGALDTSTEEFDQRLAATNEVLQQRTADLARMREQHGAELKAHMHAVRELEYIRGALDQSETTRSGLELELESTVADHKADQDKLRTSQDRAAELEARLGEAREHIEDLKAMQTVLVDTQQKALDELAAVRDAKQADHDADRFVELQGLADAYSGLGQRIDVHSEQALQIHERVEALVSTIEVDLKEQASRLGEVDARVDRYMQGLLSAQDSTLRSIKSSIALAGGKGSKRDDGATRELSSRWLDLLEDALTGIIYKDEAQSPWNEEAYEASTRLLGRDWPANALTMIGTARMKSLRGLCELVLSEGVAGDFLEAGVWRGGASIYIRAILLAWQETDRRVFVADSFEGLPEPNVEAYPQDAGDTHSQFEALSVSLAQVQENFQRFGLLDEQVEFVPGFFKDTLHQVDVDALALLRLDGDMYESTIQTLDALYEKVSPGGVVIIDDYVLEPCAAAVNDFRSAHQIEIPMNEVDGAAVWWQIPARRKRRK